MWLSTINHDLTLKPLDQAVFWIEFLMHHKRAKTCGQSPTTSPGSSVTLWMCLGS